MTQFTPDIGAGHPRVCMLKYSRARDPALSLCRWVLTFSPPSSQHTRLNTSNRCPCALREDTAIPGLELLTPFKQQRRSCRTDGKLIINPQRVDNETKFSSSDIFQQTQAQPFPDSPASSRSPIFTCTHHHFSGNFQTT